MKILALRHNILASQQNFRYLLCYDIILETLKASLTFPYQKES